MFINIYYQMWIINIVLPLALLITQVKADDTTCGSNLTLHDTAVRLSYRQYGDKCTLQFETQSHRNIIAIFPARNLTFSEYNRYRLTQVYDGDIDMNNATLLGRLTHHGRYFKGRSFSTTASHMTVSTPKLDNYPKINIEIKLDDCDKQVYGLKGEFQTTQYPGLNGLSYPINAYCKITIIPFLGCSTNLHISEYDVEEEDDLYIMLKNIRTSIRGPMIYQIQPSESFSIVLDASSQTDAASGIRGNFSVCYRLTFSLSGQISLPLDPFRRKNMSSTCAFLIGSPIESITNIFIDVADAETNTNSYVELYRGFQCPRLMKAIKLSQWNRTESFQSMSNETIVVYHVIQGERTSVLHISYSSSIKEDLLMKEIMKPAAAVCAISIAVNFVIYLLIRQQLECKPAHSVLEDPVEMNPSLGFNSRHPEEAQYENTML